MLNEEQKDQPTSNRGNITKPVLAEVPADSDARQVIGDASNVICHLNDLIHKLAFGANDRLCRSAYQNAVEYFERLSRHFG